jgi:hypothetical protein
MFGILVGSLVLGGSATASAQNWGRPRVPSAGACFYEDVNFNGQYFCSRAGSSNPEVPPGTNDRISSIRVFGNAEVIVFRDRQFDGRSRRFDADVSDLRETGWNDRISSFRIVTGGSSHEWNWGGNWGRPQRPSAGVCFYEDVNFEGEYFCARAGTASANLPSGTNDRISSIRLFGNASVTVFRDSGFDGRSVRFNEDTPDLRRSGWNDRISSFRVTGGGFGGRNRNQGGAFGSGARRQMSRRDAEAVVRRAYQSVLGREPDPGSRDYVTQVMNGEMSELEVMADLRNSQEYRDRQRQRR